MPRVTRGGEQPELPRLRELVAVARADIPPQGRDARNALADLLLESEAASVTFVIPGNFTDGEISIRTTPETLLNGAEMYYLTTVHEMPSRILYERFMDADPDRLYRQPVGYERLCTLLVNASSHVAYDVATRNARFYYQTSGVLHKGDINVAENMVIDRILDDGHFTSDYIPVLRALMEYDPDLLTRETRRKAVDILSRRVEFQESAEALPEAERSRLMKSVRMDQLIAGRALEEARAAIEAIRRSM